MAKEFKLYKLNQQEYENENMEQQTYLSEKKNSQDVYEEIEDISMKQTNSGNKNDYTAFGKHAVQSSNTTAVSVQGPVAGTNDTILPQRVSVNKKWKILTIISLTITILQSIVFVTVVMVFLSKDSSINQKVATLDNKASILDNKISSLQGAGNSTSEQLWQAIGSINEKDSSIDGKIATLDNKVSSLQSVGDSTSTQLWQAINNIKEKAGFTVCAGKMISGQVIKFTAIISSFGLTMNSVYEDGVFTVKDGGFYYITVNVLGDGHNGFKIIKNGQTVSWSYFHWGGNTNGLHTGSTSGFVKMVSGDTISVKGFKTYKVDPACCMTVIKL